MMISNLPARKNIFAGAASTWLLGVTILFGASGTTMAKHATLHIQRNDAGSVLQFIPLSSFGFDRARNILQATSAVGDLVCPDKVVAKSNKFQLVLDGKAYAVDRIRQDSVANVIFTVQPAGSDLFPLCRHESVSILSTKSSHSLDLEIQDLTTFGIVGGPLSPGSSIDFDPVAMRMTAIQDSSNQTLACFVPSVSAASTSLHMHLRDRNGVYQNIRGISSLAYIPSGEVSTMRINAIDGLYCLPLPAAGLPRTTQSVNDFILPDCPAVPVSDTLFAGGFEDDEVNTGFGPDLLVDLRLAAAPTPNMSDPMTYEIYVKNCSTTDIASNVLIKDFFPTNRDDASMPVNTDNGQLRDAPGDGLTCLVDGAPRACSAPVILDPVNGPAVPYLTVEIGDLAPGEVARVGITRIAEMPTSGLPTIRINAAVTSDVTNEPFYDNNSGSWDVNFLDTNNLLPTLNFSGAAGNLTEDDSATLITGITITAVDLDGTISSVEATSRDQSMVTDGNISVDDSNLNDIKVTVTPVPDAFGTVTLNVVATDNLGGASMVQTIDVVIDGVNDPPLLTVKGGFDYNGGSILLNGPNCTQDSGAGCANHSYPANVGVLDASDFSSFLDWVVDISPGPDNEADSGQTATVAVTLQSDESPSVFLDAILEPKLGAGTMNLKYILSGNSGTATVLVTVNDGQGPGNNSTTNLTFTIMVDNSAPIVTAGQILTIDENSAGSVDFVAATDGDGDLLQNWMILSGNDDIDGDELPPFAINVTSGEITVNDVGDLDFERMQQFVLGITVTDGPATSMIESVTIKVLNVDEAALAVTDPASDVLDVSATLNGTVAANDTAPAIVSFEYGITNAYGKFASVASQTGSLPAAVSADLMGLACTTNYHYRVTVSNTLGTTEGLDETFTTSSCVLPSISGHAEVNVTGTTATLQGLVNPNGSDTTNIRFSYGIGSLSNVNDNSIAATPATLLIADGETQVTADLTGLTPCKTYRYYLEATNSAGPTDGGTVPSFDTACP